MLRDVLESMLVFMKLTYNVIPNGQIRLKRLSGTNQLQCYAQGAHEPIPFLTHV